MALDQLSQVRTRRAPRAILPLGRTGITPVSEASSSVSFTYRPNHRWSRAYRWGIAASDLTIASTATSIMFWPVFPPFAALVGGLVSGIVLALLIGFMHGYDFRRSASGNHDYLVIIRAGWIWASLVIATLYFGAISLTPQSVLLVVMSSLLFILGSRYAQRALMRIQRRRGRWTRRTLLVGDAEQLQYVTSDLWKNLEHGYEIIGMCGLPSAEDDSPVPVLSDVDRAAEVIIEQGAQVAIVAASCMDAAQLRRFSWKVERHGVELLIVPNLQDVAPRRVSLRPVSESPLLCLEITPRRWQRILKSAIDRTVGLVLLFFALPVLGSAALAVRLDSAGPALYRQIRIGRDDRPFQMLKLRSMYTDADARREALLAQNEGNEVLFKMREDPRITRVGRVLRRFSIDELPQLWNVVRGDMSLVGPRPPLGEEVAQYEGDAHQRLRVKPGLTGLWQVSGRSDLDWAHSLRLDLRYVDNWSVLMDLAILTRTFKAVLGGRGAY